ncbi:hypothetical protein [Alicyclobacillus ferrooxydans]|uniref:Uncharacterized protein n=1 Tax=Alicyclobacillus ferrooxydans TaxID=471514 RepID=A0A0P9CZV8_9BACL|nr:hypothetical protein [Alicyclobacillus ferrooxydans]KPV45272.1 hypothetical protein AN477_02440 [Alicyclobacillus ferrooxydans]
MEHTHEANLHVSLQELLNDIADTIAAFDGRIGYTTTSTGQCQLSFAGQHETASVTIKGSVKEQGLVKVQIVNENTDASDEPQTLYDGPFSPAAMYQKIGAGLAQWYGDLVRNRT